MNQEGEASAAWSAAVDTSQQFTGYNIRGVLNFLQKNWSSFERDKAAWEAEQAELKAYIAFLEGERRGQINLKRDLVRRIKMLEYALKQERAKYLALVNGKNANEAAAAVPKLSSSSTSSDAADALESSAAAKIDLKLRPASLASTASPRAAIKKSRHILRKYLNEIGITDSAIQAEAEAVRDAVDASILFNAEEDAAVRPQVRLLLKSTDSAGDASRKKIEQQNTVVELSKQTDASGQQQQQQHQQHQQQQQQQQQQQSVPSPVPIVVESLPVAKVTPSVASEEEAIAEFDFLSSEDDDKAAPTTNGTANGSASTTSSTTTASTPSTSKSDADDALAFLDETLDSAEKSSAAESAASPSKAPAEDAKAVADLSSLLPRKGKVRASAKSMMVSAVAAAVAAGDEEGDELEESKYDSNQLAKVMKHYERDKKTKGGAVRGKSGKSGKSSVMDMFGAEEEESSKNENHSVTDSLGELADLSVAGDAESGEKFDTDASSHHQWKPKFTLRGHFDSVRAVAFHDTESAVLSASEDHTIKLWNFRNVPSASKKTTHSPDLEPVYTYRGHADVVTSVVIAVRDGIFFSGSLDTTVRVWKLCSLAQPSYADFDASVEIAAFTGHENAVWGLALHPVNDTLVSIGADKAVIVWNYRQLNSPLVKKITLDHVPTSVAFINSNLSHFVVSTSAGKLHAFDVASGAKVLDFDTAGEPSFINQVVSHPTLPLLITANDDKTIKFFDANDGHCTHSMIAHLDAVSCLAIDHSGLFLLSGGHDSSLRLWDIAKKSCLQEISSHRKKFDEAVHAVIFHPFLPYVASGGADASIKIYV